MCPLHVFVGLSSATKRLHTEPADVDPARDARHVIATKRFLNRHSALGAVSHVIVFLPPREFFVSLQGSFDQGFVGLTCEPVMGILVAARADGAKAAVAVKGPRFFSVRDSIEAVAVWCRAVSESDCSTVKV
jgi:hypothetical protein